MKRLIMIALALLCLTGCGAPEAPADQENFTFTHNGVEITLHAEAAPVLEALGEPRTYTEEASCAFEGLDKTYYYGSFYLTTYPMEGKDYVYTLWFADDTVTTAKGIRIGSTKTQVEQAYGQECLNEAGNCVRIQGRSRLVILMAEDVVISVRYEGILN